MITRKVKSVSRYMLLQNRGGKIGLLHVPRSVTKIFIDMLLYVNKIIVIA